MTLSSCYFCGTALDAPVSAHVLGDGSDDPAVSLCPTCRRKLAAVLDAVADPDAATAALDTGDEDDSASDGTAPPDDATVGQPRASAGDSGGAGDASNAGSEEANDSSGADVTVSEKATLESDTNLLHDVGDPNEDRDSDAGDSDNPEGDDADDPDGEGDSDDGGDEWAAVVGEAEPSDDRPDEEHTDASDDPGTDAGSEPAPDRARTAEGDDEADGGDPAILSTPTAKKVIRLLQNREFPVEREEFEVVAASAYDLQPGKCADVVDALVTEGYVAEEGGRLVEPT